MGAYVPAPVSQVWGFKVVYESPCVCIATPAASALQSKGTGSTAIARPTHTGSGSQLLLPDRAR